MKKTLYALVLFFVLSKLSAAQVLAQDSLAVDGLYTINIVIHVGPVSAWPGITVTGNRVTAIDLSLPSLSPGVTVTVLH